MSEKPEVRFAKAAWNLADECAKLEAENERLREALVRFGKHGADCDAYRGCACGLDDALRGEG